MNVKFVKYKSLSQSSSIQCPFMQWRILGGRRGDTWGMECQTNSENY